MLFDDEKKIPFCGKGPSGDPSMSNCTLLCTQNAAFDQILESYKKFSCILTDFCLISSSLTNIDLLADPVFFF